MDAETLHRVQARTTTGMVEGVVSADGNVRAFKGIPYAAPPVGALRWKPPQPLAPWTGVRPAVEFGPRPMQGHPFSDMVFRDQGPSEDCLYLNVWAPEQATTRKLPVMVWIFGGGYVAGGTSEPRQDGSKLCQRGVIVVSMNYRLGIFGFFAHPELTQESEHHASGNYGLMDQIAALRWVHDNIAQFGGDPANVTIFGESAGSFSVSSLVASPLARGLFHKAIGESGALFSATRPTPTVAQAQKEWAEFAERTLHANTLASLRAMSAADLLEATVKPKHPRIGAVIDGYVLPSDSVSIYGNGRQAHVPLLAGWNRDEGSADGLLGNKPATLDNYIAAVKQRYGSHADEVLRVYHATNDAEAKRAAADLQGDNFIGYSTWKWLELHRKTSGSPVYRYEFDQPLPAGTPAMPSFELRVPHASDIEFVFETLPERHIPWTPAWSEADWRASQMLATYWTNFAKTGNPNGGGLPNWPTYDAKTGFEVMHLQAAAAAQPDVHRARYLLLDKLPRRGEED